MLNFNGTNAMRGSRCYTKKPNLPYQISLQFYNIFRYNEDFRGYDQQDAHELLSHLIEWLHDDLNEIRQVIRYFKK